MAQDMLTFILVLPGQTVDQIVMSLSWCYTASNITHGKVCTINAGKEITLLNVKQVSIYFHGPTKCLTHYATSIILWGSYVPT